MQSGTGVARRKSKVVYLLIAVVTIASAIGIYIGFAPTPYDEASHTPALTQITPSSVVPSTSPSAAPQPPALPQDFVAQAMPTSLTVTNGGSQLLSSQEIGTTLRKKTASGDFVLGWPDDAMGFVDDPGVPWAVLPGSTAGKAVILCHANASPPMVCNPLGTVKSVQDASSYQMVLGLPGGELTYQLVQLHPVPKDQYFAWLRDAPNTTGRVYVAMCQLDSPNGLLLNTQTVSIWEFALVSSKAS